MFEDMDQPGKRHTFSKELIMFWYENRMAIEVCWAGFGFQIWIQPLTHLIKNKDADILVVDEQKFTCTRIYKIRFSIFLRLYSRRTVLATHSVEIINNAEPAEVVVIDKSLRSAKRISDIEGLQVVNNLMESGQNIQLTRLARGKKILFVEGNDIKLLSKLAKTCGHLDLLNNGEITVIPIEGFSKHDRIPHTNWAFTTILGEQLKIAALFDRDYRCESTINEFKEKFEKQIDYVHFFQRKEIENYLLIPSAIENAVFDKIRERFPKKQPTGILDTSLRV